MRSPEYVMATRFAVALFVISPLLSGPWQAADYPNKPIRWVLGFAPGGAPDNIARVVGKHLTAVMGQAVILDNRPGANGIIGSDLVANATPDGYTMLVTSAAFALNAGAYRKLPSTRSRVLRRSPTFVCRLACCSW